MYVPHRIWLASLCTRLIFLGLHFVIATDFFYLTGFHEPESVLVLGK